MGNKFIVGIVLFLIVFSVGVLGNEELTSHVKIKTEIDGLTVTFTDETVNVPASGSGAAWNFDTSYPNRIWDLDYSASGDGYNDDPLFYSNVNNCDIKNANPGTMTTPKCQRVIYTYPDSGTKRVRLWRLRATYYPTINFNSWWNTRYGVYWEEEIVLTNPGSTSSSSGGGTAPAGGGETTPTAPLTPLSDSDKATVRTQIQTRLGFDLFAHENIELMDDEYWQCLVNGFNGEAEPPYTAPVIWNCLDGYYTRIYDGISACAVNFDDLACYAQYGLS